MCVCDVLYVFMYTYISISDYVNVKGMSIYMSVYTRLCTYMLNTNYGVKCVCNMRYYTRVVSVTDITTRDYIPSMIMRKARLYIIVGYIIKCIVIHRVYVCCIYESSDQN